MPSRSDSAVRIRTQRGGRGLFATCTLRAGETILVAEGELHDVPTRGSLQVGVKAHLAVPDDAAVQEHPWRFLNHACRPNAAFQGRRLVALAAIASGDELTFDYETTEWELDAPFACACASPGCSGRLIRGFRHLSRAERARRLPQLRADLRRLALDPDGPPAER